MTSKLSSKFYYKKSRLQQLKGFYYTYQKGSIQKAAEEMGLGSSTVSMQIKSLENDLNTILFEKKGNKLIPTKKAGILYKMAVPLIHSADALFEKFTSNSREEDENHIHLACHSNVSYEILPKHIKSFTEKNPKVVFEIEHISLEESIEKIIDKELDFAIFPVDMNNRANDNVEYIDFYEDEVVLVLPKNHPLANKPDDMITNDDITKTNFVCIDKELYHSHKYLNFLINNNEFHNNLLFKNASWEIVKSMIKNEICIAGFSEKYVNDEDRQYIITKRVKNLFPSFKYCIIIKKKDIFNNNIKNFLKLIKNDINFSM